MNETLLALVAFSPIVVAAILLVGLNWPAKKAMPVAFALTVAIALIFWDMSANRVIASVLQGLGITVSVLWIVFGAIFLLNTLKYTGAITTIRNGFTNISPDRRVQASSSLGVLAPLLKGLLASERLRRLPPHCWLRLVSPPLRRC